MPTVQRLLLLIFSVITLNASAQIGEHRSQWGLGVSGGITLNRVSFAPSVTQDMKISPSFGLVARYTSEKYFSMICSIQFELNYANLGWKEDIISSHQQPLADTYKRDIHYIQLPILARLGIGKEKRGLMGYLVAGPQIGYAFSEKSIKGDIWTLTPSGKPDRLGNINAQYDLPVERRFDYGITAGLGMELSTKIGHFMIEGRYYLGLSDIFGNSKKDPFSRSDNNTIYARMTYLFDL